MSVGEANSTAAAGLNSHHVEETATPGNVFLNGFLLMRVREMFMDKFLKKQTNVVSRSQKI